MKQKKNLLWIIHINSFDFLSEQRLQTTNTQKKKQQHQNKKKRQEEPEQID